ncbi:putative F-box protein At1g59675 isoform X1 [Rhododendron vialii]|uniref:putative F-box protein At1g59675 isoform X1 n=1 Tax=Rhododendron vialii TaxID=182163 RepID=UPI00265FFF11|nr:putative F-box protein At1g59675 isoform X1 [Rhododendron vialii]
MASTKLTVARTTFDLPFEITVEILSRLPVKSLLRFKSVCKTWKFNIRADLYVMSTDTWMEIDFNKLLLFLGEMNELGEFVNISGSFATALNGVFYWPARVVPTNQVVVVSFDMGNEVFRRIRTPECLHWTQNLTHWQFAELDDKIALVVSPDERGFDVWVLNENESCWTNHIKVGAFPRIASDMGYEVDGDITVVGGGKNGEL